MKPTPSETAIRLCEMEKLIKALGFSREEANFALAAQAAFRGETAVLFLQRFSRRDLVRIARCAAALRDTAFRLGGTKRLAINRRSIPKTGQTLALIRWLSGKDSGFRFRCSEARLALCNFSLQQVQNAVAYSVKIGQLRCVEPKRAQIPALYEKLTKD